jgi:hypothetical protein
MCICRAAPSHTQTNAQVQRRYCAASPDEDVPTAHLVDLSRANSLLPSTWSTHVGRYVHYLR